MWTFGVVYRRCLLGARFAGFGLWVLGLRVSMAGVLVTLGLPNGI